MDAQEKLHEIGLAFRDQVREAVGDVSRDDVLWSVENTNVVIIVRDLEISFAISLPEGSYYLLRGWTWEGQKNVVEPVEIDGLVNVIARIAGVVQSLESERRRDE